MRLSRSSAKASPTLIARFNPRSTVKPDEAVEVSVSTENIHFFDPESFERIR